MLILHIELIYKYRSRSPDRRRRYSSRSRSRSRSRGRIEKPIVRHSEFRPRVPEKDKEKEKKAANEVKKEKKTPAVPKTASSNTSGKKLPFIGKMPVFKKATTTTEGGQSDQMSAVQYDPHNAAAYGAVPRPLAPTAAQIQMAMMEDAFGNAPPFHPDAGVMMDYDDLMPDPVQFVNIMHTAPPPPPPSGEKKGNSDDDDKPTGDEDILPPGIDEPEVDQDFASKPLTPAPPAAMKGK